MEVVVARGGLRGTKKSVSPFVRSFARGGMKTGDGCYIAAILWGGGKLI